MSQILQEAWDSGNPPPGESDDRPPPPSPGPPQPTHAQAVENLAAAMVQQSLEEGPEKVSSHEHRMLQAMLMVAYQLAGIRDELEILREIEEDRADSEGV